MLYDYVQPPVCFELSTCACSVFHHELLCANLFRNLLSSVSHFAFFSVSSLYLFLSSYWVEFGLLHQRTLNSEEVN